MRSSVRGGFGLAILGDVFSRMVSTVQSQLMGMTSWVFRLQNIGTQLAQSAQQKLQKYMHTLTKKPSSKEDYWKAFGLYFSKKFVVMTSVVVVVLGYVSVYYAYPWAEGKWWTAEIKINSEKYTIFTGKVRVIDTDGTLIYEGDMEKGNPSGYGTQYKADGSALYSGYFKSGKYSGEGNLYNSEGLAIYSGSFLNNKYDGKGKLYNDLGKILYSGEFSAGQKSGKGIEYDPLTGLKVYYGQFENDVRQGSGVLFDSDGETILYEGNFEAGRYEGSGKLYSGGNIVYLGEFVNGSYEGEGSLYDPKTGALIYAGSFKEGLFDGQGKYYDTNTGTVIYEGKFSKGKKQGQGSSYDSLGSKTFSGTFRGDSIDYIEYLGSTVDEVTGQFGQESYRKEVDNKLIMTYLSLDASIIFKVDSEKGVYVCEKVVLGTKDAFMGLGAQSTAIERREVMGEPFSSIDYNMPNYYKTVLQNLAININDLTKVPSDKYIMDKYFIRFYFNEGRTELKCIEISSM